MPSETANPLTLLEQALNRGEPCGSTIADLANLPETGRVELLKRFDSERRTQLVVKLNAHAHDLLSRSPKHALTAATLAVKLARAPMFSASPTGPPADDALLSEGDAWRLHAHALVTSGNAAAAMESANEAAFVYALALPTTAVFDGDVTSLLMRVPRDAREKSIGDRVATLAMIMGQALHELDDSDAGFLLVEQAAHICLSFLDDKRKYVQGKTICAMIRAARGRHSEAASMLEDTSRLAKELGDYETLAYILNNIGFSYFETGQIAKARRCFETALKMCTDLGLSADAIRPRNYLAAILIKEGQYNRAISELFVSRAAYLAVGLAHEAALVMLKIMRAFVLSGRAGSINWQDAITTFADAGVRPEVLAVLLTLHELAHRRGITTSDIDRAEATLMRAEESHTDEEAG